MASQAVKGLGMPHHLALETGRAGGGHVEITWPSGSVAVVALVGEHDLGQFEPVRDALEVAAIRRRHVVVDLRGCEFLDSTVITVLLHAHDEVTTDRGRFSLVIREGGAVARVADVMCLHDLFAIHGSLDEALASACARRESPAA
jgi:anti-anti-sigma factor